MRIITAIRVRVISFSRVIRVIRVIMVIRVIRVIRVNMAYKGR
jgi:hypothetical protein